MVEKRDRLVAQTSATILISMLLLASALLLIVYGE